jgi:putative phosphoribosyl transferase
MDGSDANRSLTPFRDRSAAGRQLGAALRESAALERLPCRPVVVGLARGGVEVAAEVADVLGAPLDALAVRKIRHPWQPEYGIGAVAPGGIVYLRARDGLAEEEVARATARAAAEADELDARLHEGHPPVAIAAEACVLVDDGLATGGTMAAAIRWARAGGAARVVVAVPVGAAETCGTLEREGLVDFLVCLVAPPAFGAVGFWYEDFRQLSDKDVREILSAHPAGLVRA